MPPKKSPKYQVGDKVIVRSEGYIATSGSDETYINTFRGLEVTITSVSHRFYHYRFSEDLRNYVWAESAFECKVDEMIDDIDYESFCKIIEN